MKIYLLSSLIILFTSTKITAQLDIIPPLKGLSTVIVSVDIHLENQQLELNAEFF